MAEISPQVQLSVLAYAATFNAKDLEFRKVRSSYAFVTAYLKALRLPTPPEQQILTPALSKISTTLFKLYHRIAAIPFKILILTEPGLENNMPHTHADTIVLPASMLAQQPPVADSKLIVTLIHEQLHVFQKLYPLEMHKFYTTYWGYTLVRLQHLTNARSNPDNNRILYRDAGGISFNNEYTQGSSSIRDIKDARDHPNEVFAYKVADELALIKTLDPAIVNLLSGPTSV